MQTADQSVQRSAKGRAKWLWILLALFCLRVLGQVLVAFWNVRSLPPMSEWFSGLIPYPVLLASQVLIIVLLGTVCIQFSRGRGWFVERRRKFGLALTYFGLIYLGSMVV